MKKIILLSLAILLAYNSQAQQEPLFAQYNTNMFLINPAVAGSKGNHSIAAFHRWQWVSFPGAPQTYGVTYQGNIKEKHGIGAMVFGDVTGPISRWGAKASYAFHIPLAAKKMRLSLGLAGRFTQNRILANAITFIETNDQAVANIGDGGIFNVDFEFGAFLYGKKFYVGLAAPNLAQGKLDFGNNPGARNPIGRGYRHYFLTGGYRFDLGKEKKMAIEPSIMVKYTQGGVPQVDGGLTMHVLDDQISFGIFYRTPSFLSFQARFLFDNKVPLLISFDISTARFQNYSVGATEVMLGYDFPTQANFWGDAAPANEMEEGVGEGNL